MDSRMLRNDQEIEMLTINEIRALPMVASANEWKDRIYINLRSNGGNFAGERNSKIWVREGVLTVEMGKGSTSREWYANLQALRAIFKD